MPATTKADLLEKAHKDFAKLDALLDSVPAYARLIPDPDADGATLKDIVAHRATWIAMLLEWRADGLAGRPAQVPAPGYKWNDLRQFNADLRAQQADMGWDAARAALCRNHGRLIALIDSLDDAALYGAPMPGGNSPWTTGRWAEANGPSHYRSAATYIRRRLRQIAGP